MPETYDVIVAAIKESNLTTPALILQLTTLATPLRNSNAGGGRGTTVRESSNEKRSRVSRYVRNVLLKISGYSFETVRCVFRLFR